MSTRDGRPSLGTGPSRLVAYGQIGFTLFVAVCVALHPGFVLKSNEGGMSNYGVHAKTVAPYSLAFITAGVFSYWEATLLSSTAQPARVLRQVILTYVGLLALTLVTTYAYTRSTVLKDLHIGAGALLTVFEFSAVTWMQQRFHLNRVIFGIGVVGFILSLLTFVGVLHVLFLSQVVLGASFALFLTATCRRIQHRGSDLVRR